MANLILSRRQSQAVDRIAIERFGYSGLVLMENAGRGVVEVLLRVDDQLANDAHRKVAILCGKGNNAGDGFVIARQLAIQNVDAMVILLRPASEMSADALANYKLLGHTKTTIVDLSDVDDLPNSLSHAAAGAAWLIDAMLGTGVQGQPREPIATAIRWSNAQPARRLAVDVPSGLDCDTGQPTSATFRADHTCTFVAPKQGFQFAPAPDYVGRVHVVSIGIPPNVVSEWLDE
ncbi:MAG: NAD(P)H-hydrate epimerase [Planctomycetota bacterium]